MSKLQLTRSRLGRQRGIVLAAVTAVVASSPSPARDTSSSSPWLWALLIALGIGGVGVAMAVTQSRRRTRSWDEAYADAVTSAQWVHDRLLPGMLAGPGSSQSGTLWSSARSQVLELDERLTALARQAPDPARGEAAQALRAALAEVSAAVDAEVNAAGTDQLTATTVRVEFARGELGRRLTQSTVSPVATSEPGSSGAGR